MPPRSVLIPAIANPADPAQIRRHAAEVSDFINRPIAGCRLSAGVQAGNARTFTGQVIDRRGASMSGRWVVLVTVAATDGGAPSATDNTMSVTTGTVIETVTANAAVRVLTDAAGAFAFSLTLGGSGARTRYVAATAEVEIVDSAFGWT